MPEDLKGMMFPVFPTTVGWGFALVGLGMLLRIFLLWVLMETAEVLAEVDLKEQRERALVE